ncbi:hypothetical protein [Halorussus pelagicus]|uniref:hypothetical protein n=1 Tax=Halorussus pelagicus TaxID=2505977 RepID=UPI000FFCBCC2|nr:hypothetical protein [Halorussus pelagicus]
MPDNKGFARPPSSWGWHAGRRSATGEFVGSPTRRVGHMSEGWGDYETIFCSNGWIEIRNSDETDHQWIASDTPVSIDR